MDRNPHDMFGLAKQMLKFHASTLNNLNIQQVL